MGYKRLLRFKTVRSGKVRVNILGSRSYPSLAEFGLYRMPDRRLGRLRR